MKRQCSECCWWVKRYVKFESMPRETFDYCCNHSSHLLEQQVDGGGFCEHFYPRDPADAICGNCAAYNKKNFCFRHTPILGVNLQWPFGYPGTCYDTPACFEFIAKPGEEK